MVAELLSAHDASHDFAHTQRVLRTALSLAAKEGLSGADELERLQLVALLHDVDDWKYKQASSPTGLVLADSWLRNNGCSDDSVRATLADIAAIGFREQLSAAEAARPAERSRVASIVQDADRLDALGAIGILRCATYGGAKGRTLYDTADLHTPPGAVLAVSAAQYEAGHSTTMRHFNEKLFKLRDSMNTASGRAEAESRHRFMVDFVRRFQSECLGGDEPAAVTSVEEPAHRSKRRMTARSRIAQSTPSVLPPATTPSALCASSSRASVPPLVPAPPSASSTDSLDSSSAQSGSLWAVLAPFDASATLAFVRLHVWPYLRDVDGVRSMCVNRATVQHFSAFPMREPFTVRPIQGYLSTADAALTRWPPRGERYTPTQPLVPARNTRCLARVLRLTGVREWSELAPLLPRLPHLTQLDMNCVPDGGQEGLLPTSLTRLSLTQPPPPYRVSHLPPSLTELRVEHGVSWLMNVDGRCPEPGSLPTTLRSLHWNVSATLERDVLPLGLTTLHLDSPYNAPLVPGSLPATLTHLQIGRDFTHAIPPGFIPASLSTLALATGNFDQSLQRVFPPDSQLRTLGMTSESFNQPLTARCLPASLTELNMWGLERFNRPLAGCLPASLTALYLPGHYRQRLQPGHLPAALRALWLPHTYKPRLAIGTLPPSLTYLHLGDAYNHPLEGLLPDSLQLLVVGAAFQQPFHDVDALPSALCAISRAAWHFDRAHLVDRRAEFARLHAARLDVAQHVLEELEARCNAVS